MRLWVDDERPAPKGWLAVTTSDAALDILEKGDVTEVSLDHDLGDDDNGYRVITWIEEKVFTDSSYRPPSIAIHTSNPSARVKMELAAAAIANHLAKRDDA